MDDDSTRVAVESRQAEMEEMVMVPSWPRRPPETNHDRASLGDESEGSGPGGGNRGDKHSLSFLSSVSRTKMRESQ